MNLIYNLKCILIQTKYIVHGQEQIKHHVPQLYNWVDVILETNTHFICFKDIWSYNNLTPEILNIYINGSMQQNIFSNSGKKYIFVLLIKNSNTYFDNKVLNNQNIHIIKSFTQKKLLKELSYFLYSNKIFYYEIDDSCIMLD